MAMLELKCSLLFLNLDTVLLFLKANSEWWLTWQNGPAWQSGMPSRAALALLLIKWTAATPLRCTAVGEKKEESQMWTGSLKMIYQYKNTGLATFFYLPFIWHWIVFVSLSSGSSIRCSHLRSYYQPGCLYINRSINTWTHIWMWYVDSKKCWYGLRMALYKQQTSNNQPWQHAIM